MVIGDTLYGTNGGVFSVPLSGGTPAVLASVNNLQSSLTLVGQTLYGTANSGGVNGNGEVFSVPLTGGPPKVLASFHGNDGADPDAGLTLVGQTLYGTTNSGGVNGNGMVFSVPLTGGTPTVLASLNGGNGASPLTVVGNTLYGTADGGAYGQGMVFSVPLTGGSATILASFNGSNGSYPNGLTLVGDSLYGVTASGGPGGDGTVFALNLNPAHYLPFGLLPRTETGAIRASGTAVCPTPSGQVPPLPSPQAPA